MSKNTKLDITTKIIKALGLLMRDQDFSTIQLNASEANSKSSRSGSLYPLNHYCHNNIKFKKQMKNVFGKFAMSICHCKRKNTKI